MGTTTRYTDKIWVDSQDVGNLQVHSRRIQAILGVHHAVVVSGIGDKWTVYQWGVDSEYNFASYACQQLKGNTCIKNLGKVKLKDVYKAAQQSSDQKYDVKSYNCNHWVQRVCSILGKTVTVHWNCCCVLQWNKLNITLINHMAKQLF